MNETGEPTFESCARRVVRALSDYLERSREGSDPVIRLRTIHEIREELKLDEWIENGRMTEGDLEDFVLRYLSGTTRLHHPGFMAHMVAAPLFPASLADLINGATNNAMAIFEMGPPAVVVELAILDWMIGKIGWETAAAGGVLTHGGSLANLTALLTARHAADPRASEDGTSADLALLCTAGSHYSVGRAAMIMGLGRGSVYSVPVDARCVMRPDALAETRARAEADGRRVMAVVANACSTPTGLYDPLEEVGRFCRQHDLWFHVDGAHGASALISDRERSLLAGIDLADSVIWDAHKLLGSSTLCAAVLLRNGSRLEAAFQEQASYIGDRPLEGVNLIHRTVECTKAPLGLKLFLNLAIFGEDGLARRIEELFSMSRRLHRLIAARPGFECPYVPQSNIICFRYGGDNTDQAAIRDQLLRRGQFYLSQTEIGGQQYLRLCVMNSATTEETITRLLDEIETLSSV